MKVLYDPMEITGTIGENAAHEATLTFNKTASELFDAALAGRMCKIMRVTKNESGSVVEAHIAVLPCEAFLDTNGGSTSYTFKLRFGSGDSDTLFYGAGFSESATVVLTAVPPETVFVPFTVGSGGASTTATFNDVKAAVAADKNVIAKIALASGMTVYGGLTGKAELEGEIVQVYFGLVIDFAAAAGATPAPQLMQITFNAGGVTAKVLDLTVAAS